MERIFKFKNKMEKDNMGNYFFTPTIYNDDFRAIQIQVNHIIDSYNKNKTYDKDYIMNLGLLRDQICSGKKYTTKRDNFTGVEIVCFSPEQTKRFLKLKKLVENPVYAT